jgi:general secretion pathway protein G
MKNRKKSRGFTMVELMAVLVIISLLATMVTTQVVKQIRKAKVETTKANLKTLHTAVNHFFMDIGRIPTQEEGLEALINPPADADVEGYDPSGYIEQTKIPKDGWKHDFLYEVAPESGKPFDIRSAGPDGELYTEDDLVSTDIE